MKTTKIKAATLLRRTAGVLDIMEVELTRIVQSAKDRGRSPRVVEMMIRKKLYRMTDKFEDVLTTKES